MDANELADYLDNNVEAMIMSEQTHIDQAATMLRQQQNEIEALKKEAALQRLSDFTQEADNEPVAWMSQGGDVTRSKDYFVEMGFTDLIPLYTHPVKELTDSEIEQISHQYHYTYNPDYIGFARAILRKAQEKYV